MARDYKKEYRDYIKEKQKEPDEIRKRVMRNQARREAIREVGREALKGKDVDHIKALSKGGSNAKSNRRIIDAKKNGSKGNK
jgi:5-methylcytosine-specific restriction endonuclease McrA